MLKFASIEEILRFAISKEDASSQLYVDMAGRMEDEPSRSIFMSLSKEETRHKQDLELELMKLGIAVNTETDDPSNRTAADYILETDIKTITFPDALSLAIEKEKAAFRLYCEMIAMSEDEESTQTFLRLAEEETRHMIMFETEYNKVIPPKID